MGKFIFALVLILIKVASPANASPNAIAPNLEIYYTGGLEYSTEEDRPWLFENPVTKVCNTGVWILYSGEEYSDGNITGYDFQILLNKAYACHTTTLSYISSARLAGLRPDNSVPSVTLFREKNLQSTKFVFQDRVASFPFPVQSIVTINSDVTFYRETNYGGASYCLKFGNYCSNGTCWAWEWANFSFPWDLSLAKSAKSGCVHDAQVAANRNDADVGKSSNMYQGKNSLH